MESNGCQHYKTNVKLLTPCCNKMYTCRLCHNEQQEHTLDLSKVRALICLACNTKQDVRNSCRYCEIKFGEYSCLKCRLFDEQKAQYHCDECGICRIGPKNAFYHCDKCNLCLNRSLMNNHKCIEDVSRDNCPICTEDLHTSRDKLILLVCGHFFHEPCFNKYKASLGSELGVCLICSMQLEEKRIESRHNINAGQVKYRGDLFPRFN